MQNFFDWQGKVKETINGTNEARVNGLTYVSEKYRRENLKHNWDKYNMLPDSLTQSLKQLSIVINDSIMSPNNTKTLFDYTHDGLTVYSKNIKEQYTNEGAEQNKKITIDTVSRNYIPWLNRYGLDPEVYVDGKRVKAKSNRDKILKEQRQNIKNERKKDNPNEENIEDYKNKKKEARKAFREERKQAKKEGTWYAKTNYDNAYYSNYGQLIRSSSWIKNNIGSGDIIKIIKNKYRSKETEDSQNVNFGGSNKLDKWSVLNPENGLVDIIAKSEIGKEYSKKELKKCMFCITNLATRNNTNKMGSVMWFPPYDLNFQESVNVQWDEKQFIGRGEPIYSYVNTVRNGTLSFTLLIDHPSILNDIAQQKASAKKTDDDINKDVLNFFNGTDGGLKINNADKPNGADDPYFVNEYSYFSRLKEDNKFVYDKIKEKVKYFHPAYHSMTPEGFNMRLNFLHQCTRQGSTTGAKEVAANSVFGRPPFCELRIGDFINTRIAINSLSITYDNGGGTQWDMNPEGIGVQPMMAKVTLGIHIIGGQSLSGPVLELCNAVSNNFYANTGVYASENEVDRYVMKLNEIKKQQKEEEERKLKEKMSIIDEHANIMIDELNAELWTQENLSKINIINVENKLQNRKSRLNIAMENLPYAEAAYKNDPSEKNKKALDDINKDISWLNTEINNYQSILDTYKKGGDLNRLSFKDGISPQEYSRKYGEYLKRNYFN